MNIVIIAFNYMHAGKVPNGPGMCLSNFRKILINYGHSPNIFTNLSPTAPGIKSINNTAKYRKAIRTADLVIHWSGISKKTVEAIKFANSLNKKVFLGPNLIDTVEIDKEFKYLNAVKFDKILTVNERLKFRIMIKHSLGLDRVSVLMIGPDLSLWTPVAETDGTVLWKGNSTQFVKDIEFAKKVEALLPEYKFKFLDRYEHISHIPSAKKSKLYISTSLSETMGLALLEQWAAGIPSITHPKIYMHGINYFTGIITNRTPEDYADAIREAMEDELLYKQMSIGCRKFVEERFSSARIMKDFLDIVG